VLDQFIIGRKFCFITRNLSQKSFCVIRAGQLVSAKRAPLASFICGWFNFIGNVAGKTKRNF
jgi:hypothetical protein